MSGAPLMVAEPAIEYGPSSERTEALKLAFSATTERPALESLKISVPFSMVRRPSDRGLGEAGLGAAGLASATEGVNSQFGLPSALISRTILGSTSVTSLTSTLPVSNAPSEGFTVTVLTSTMLGFFDPGTLKNFTPLKVTVGVGRIDSAIGPSSTRSRPVTFLTMAVISGLRALRSIRLGRASSATINRPTMPPAPIRTFLRVVDVMERSRSPDDRH